MKYVLQVFTGNFSSDNYSSREIIEQIDVAINKIPVKGVIIGWSAKKELYKDIIDYLHDKGIEAWLWLPVFSDIHPSMPRHNSVDIFGEQQGGVSIMKEEDFSFVCPTHTESISNPIETYNKYFADIDFDGVFLDKIRSSSFTNKFSDSLGCFCSRCSGFYTDNDVNVLELREKLLNDPNKFIPQSVSNGRYNYSDNVINNFYKIRAKLMTSIIKTISEDFSQQGIKVSMDTYSPLFAYLIGQDIVALSSFATFIKPMIYRITHAPAGLPYEYDGLSCFFDNNFNTNFATIWGSNNIESVDLVYPQMKQLEDSQCDIYPGFEINVLKGICESTPEYVSENALLYKKLKCKSTVLSWNLLANTENNIDALSVKQGD